MKNTVEKKLFAADKNLDTLEAAIKEAWNKIQDDQMPKFYDSIVTRLNECIEKGGDKINY